MPFGISPLANLLVGIQIDTAQFNTQLNSVYNQLNSVQNEFNTFITRSQPIQRPPGIFRQLAQLYLVRTALMEIARLMLEIVKHSAEVEQGFIRIERVATNLKPGFRVETAQLAKDLPGVSLRQLQEAMIEIAELGIKDAVSLKEMAKVVAEFSTVTGKPIKEVADDFGQIIKLFQIAPSNIERTANAALQLADNFSITESELLKLTRELGEFAHGMGLTVQQTMAVAAAMKESGVSEAISRTGLFQLFSRLEAHPEKIAEAFNFTKQQVQQLYILLQQDPSGGLIRFLEMIRNKPMGEIIQGMEKARLGGRNLALALYNLAQNTAILRSALDQAAEGYDQNARLEMQLLANAEGLTAQINDLKDSWDQFLASLGNNDVVRGIIGDLTELLDIVTNLSNLTGHSANLRTKEGIAARINELKQVEREIISAQAPGFDVSGGRTVKFSDNNPIGRFLNTLWGMNNALDDRIRTTFGRHQGYTLEGVHTEIKKLQDVLNKLNASTKDNTKATNKAGGGNEAGGGKDAAHHARTPQEIIDEFNKLWNADLKKGGALHGHEHFKGFMQLEDAWKNKVLDLLDQDNPQFKELQGIHQEAINQNANLVDINNTLQNMPAGAVFQ